MFDTLFMCDSFCRFQRSDWSGRYVFHSILREEAAEMKWRISKLVFHHPSAHTAYHVHVVVDSRNDKIGQFYPYASISHREDGVEHCLQPSTAYTLVDFIAE